MKPFIPDPCNEGWDQMIPQENGRYCSRCSKTVIDFTRQTEAEIASYLETHAGKRICGRFRSDQLGRSQVIEISYREVGKLSYIRFFALALLIAFGSTLFSCRDRSGSNTLPRIMITEDTILLGDLQAPTDSGESTMGKRKDSVVKKEDQPVLPPANDFLAGEVALPVSVTGAVGTGNDTPATTFVMPQFSHKTYDLYQYIQRYLQHPQADSLLEGKVIARFTVQLNGKIGDIEILRSLRSDYDQAVIRLLENMSGWKYPEAYSGKPAKVVLPFKFSH